METSVQAVRWGKQPAEVAEPQMKITIGGQEGVAPAGASLLSVATAAASP